MFPADTAIAMANRTDKPISEVVRGDRILSNFWDDCAVVEVNSIDYEGSMVRIRYQDAGLVVATPGQLFVTERGDVPACSLVPGDRLETPYYGSGWLVYWEVESAEHFPYRGVVSGIHLDGPGNVAYCAGDVLVRSSPSNVP